MQSPHILLTLDKVHNPLRLPRKTTSEPPTVVRTPGVFNILTSKCASSYDIATSKSDPRMVCFVHFDLEMCFAPQRRVHFFDISTSKSGPELVCFLHFDFENALRATTVCTFNTFTTSQLPKVVRHWCVLYTLTSKCASRHNGVHFFDIATSKSGPNVRCF